MLKNQKVQGDVLFTPVELLPKDARPKGKLTPVSRRPDGRYVFAIGEATGHDHTTRSQTATMSLDEGGVTFLTVEELTEVEHQTHKILVLEPGTYRVTPQQEFDPFEGWRNVAD